MDATYGYAPVSVQCMKTGPAYDKNVDKKARRWRAEYRLQTKDVTLLSVNGKGAIRHTKSSLRVSPFDTCLLNSVTSKRVQRAALCFFEQRSYSLLVRFMRPGRHRCQVAFGPLARFHLTYLLPGVEKASKT